MSHPLLAVLAPVGRIVVMFALLMALPLAFAWIGGDGAAAAFAIAALATLALGTAVAWSTASRPWWS